MVTQIMEISPEMAEGWLRTNSRNRKLRPYDVKRYATDILNGDWVCTHQGIAFYDDGVLADGQHRLQAILKAKIPVLMQVTHGVTREAGLAIDMHIKRAAHDALAIMGHEEINSLKVQLIRAFISNFIPLNKSFPNISPKQVLCFYNENRDFIETTITITGAGCAKILSAQVRAAFMSAIMSGENQARLLKMVQILRSGINDTVEDTAAILLREIMLDRKNYLSGFKSRGELYRLSEKAIHCFCAKKQIQILKASDSFLYLKSFDLDQYKLAV
jgi:hypothetical protein